MQFKIQIESCSRNKQRTTWIQNNCFDHRLCTLWADDFRGAAKNWSAFFVPSASSSRPLCGVFGLMLFPQWWRIGEHSSLVTARRSHRLDWVPWLDFNQSFKHQLCWEQSKYIVDSCGRKGLGETTQCVSTRRLSSRPRKAKMYLDCGLQCRIVWIQVFRSLCVMCNHSSG